MTDNPWVEQKPEDPKHRRDGKVVAIVAGAVLLAVVLVWWVWHTMAIMSQAAPPVTP